MRLLHISYVKTLIKRKLKNDALISIQKEKHIEHTVPGFYPETSPQKSNAAFLENTTLTKTQKSFYS